MSIFKIDEPRKVLQWKKEHDNEFVDLGISKAEVTSLIERIEALEKEKEETLPIYKEYTLSYDFSQNRKLEELINEAGIEFPSKVTAFELFSTKLSEVIKEKLGEYKTNTGKHFPLMRNFLPIKFKVSESQIFGHVNYEGLDYQGLAGVTYPFSKEVELAIGEMREIPIASSGESHLIPLLGISAPYIDSYSVELGTLTEGGNPGASQVNQGLGKYAVSSFNNYATTLEYPTITLKSISIPGDRNGDYSLRERGANVVATIIHGGKVITGSDVDTSVLASEEYLKRFEPNPQNVTYDETPRLSMIITPKLERYDYAESTYKPMMMAVIIPTSDMRKALDHISKMEVGTSRLDYYEMNFLTKVLGSEQEAQKVSDIRAKLNINPIDISEHGASDIRFDGYGEDYPNLYIISEVELDQEELKLKVEGFFPAGQAKAKYKFERISHDVYSMEPVSEGEFTEDITIENDPASSLEHAEVKAVYGVGPTLHVYKANMTYPENHLTTHQVFRGVIDLKLGPSALS